MNEFKTISAHIDDIRMQIRQTSDDTIYSDKYLYKKILDARSVLVKRELDKHKLISDFNYNTICLSVAPGVPIDCGCTDLQCKVLVSDQTLPKPLQNKYALFIKVYDGSYNELPKGGMTTSKFFKYFKTLKNKNSWDIVNNKLVIYNADLRNKTFIVKILAEDPVELADYTYINSCGCDDVGETPVTCFDPATSNFPIDSWLNVPMYEMVKQQLFSNLTREDLTNNAESAISGK
jgi:hypothetical protein